MALVAVQVGTLGAQHEPDGTKTPETLMEAAGKGGLALRY